MGILQKNPFKINENASYFTIGTNRTVLIVGLGNKGKKYASTRHNVGFACVDTFAEAHEFDPWVEKKDLKSFITTKTLGDVRVILCKPTTMMNLSGEAIAKTKSFYKVEQSQFVVVHDELDLPFGQIRMRKGGSAGGHNGIKSAIQYVSEDFNRIRIGIKADTKMDVSDFVLAKFSKAEQAQMKPLTREVVSVLTEFVYRGELYPETRSFIV